MAEFPLWTIVLALFGFLVNLVVGLIALNIKGAMADIKESLASLAADDAALAARFEAGQAEWHRVEREQKDALITLERGLLRTLSSVAKDLADHKLHVAQTYARDQDMKTLTASIFRKFDDLRADLVGEIEKLVGQVRKQIEFHHPPHKD